MNELKERKCKPCEGDVSPLTMKEINELLNNLSLDWQINFDKEIFKIFEFKNYYKVMAFVNAVAWLSHKENHHPTLEVNYNSCKVLYKTHSIDGLSENDFICASKVENIIA